MRNRLGYNVTSTLRETRDQILEASSALHDLRVTIEGLSDENLRALSTWCSGLDAEYVLKLARIFGSYHAKAGVLVDTPSQGPVRRREFATPYHDEVPGEEDPLAGPPYTPGRFENPGYGYNYEEDPYDDSDDSKARWSGAADAMDVARAYRAYREGTGSYADVRAALRVARGHGRGR
jgi:hypothetical protein